MSRMRGSPVLGGGKTGDIKGDVGVCAVPDDLFGFGPLLFVMVARPCVVDD